MTRKADEWDWARGKQQRCGYCHEPLEECECEGRGEAAVSDERYCKKCGMPESMHEWEMEEYGFRPICPERKIEMVPGGRERPRWRDELVVSLGRWLP